MYLNISYHTIHHIRYSECMNKELILDSLLYYTMNYEILHLHMVVPTSTTSVEFSPIKSLLSVSLVFRLLACFVF